MTDASAYKINYTDYHWDAKVNGLIDMFTSVTGALEAWRDGTGATSVSSQGIPAIGGTMSFTVTELNRSFTVGNTYQISRVTSPATIAIGTVASWNSATKALTVTMTQSTAAAGPFTDWLITPSQPGAFPAQAGNANGVASTDGSKVTWQPMAQVKTRSGAALVGVASAVVSAAGTGYAPGNTVTLTGGTATSQAVLSVLTTQLVSLTGSSGAGYAVNDVITLANTGGTMATAPTVKVTSVTAGAITGLSVLTGGSFTGNPTGFTQASTTGAGSGAAFATAVFGVATLSPLSVGAYSAAPANPVGQGSTSGSGVGVTITATTATAYTLVAGGGANGDLAVTQDFTGGGVLTIPAMSTLGANFVSFALAGTAGVTLYPTGTDTLNGVNAPITVAKGNQAEIVVTSAGAPGNAKVIQTAGPVLLPNSGAGNAITASATLTAASAQVQRIVMTSAGQTITMPDATTLQAGANPFHFIVGGNSYSFAVRDTAGSLLAYLQPGDSTPTPLYDKSTSAGGWEMRSSSAGMLNTPVVFSSTATNNVRVASVPLTSNATTASSLIFSASASNVFSQVCTITLATGALSFTGAQDLGAIAFACALNALKLTATSGLLAVSGSRVYGWTLSGSTLTLGSVLVLSNPVGSNQVATPTFDVLSGSTTQALCAYLYNNGTNGVTGLVVLTLAGTTVTASAVTQVPGQVGSTTSFPGAGAAPQVTVLSATKAVVAATAPAGGSGNQLFALSTITLSGATISSASTTAQTISAMGSGSNLGVNNTRLVAASATTALFAYIPILVGGGGPLRVIAWSTATNLVTAQFSVPAAVAAPGSGSPYYSLTIAAIQRAPNGRYYLALQAQTDLGSSTSTENYVTAFYYDDASSTLSPGGKTRVANLPQVGTGEVAASLVSGSNRLLLAYADNANSNNGTAVVMELAA